ncbi:MAG TPA: hypothetical protein QF564_05120 [Pirellulaceae bacterium]|nr:hypothetical protein [Pirellulaceae bacterium]
MEPAGQNWFSSLASHIKELRQTYPIPQRETLDPSDEWECQIIGSSVLNWLRNIGPKFVDERCVLHKMLEIEEDPYVVFTSESPGLVAANQIIGEDDERIAYLSAEQFENWLVKNPDDSYRWHVHFWSYFTKLPSNEILEQARREYPLFDEDTYWQHVEGTFWATNAGRGVDHLWRWNGVELELLEEAISSWVA